MIMLQSSGWGIPIVALIRFTPLFLWAAASGLEPRASTTLENIRVERHLPGLAALAIYANSTLEKAATGVRKEGNTTALTTRDKFHLGSNTKAMTATLLAILLEGTNNTLTWNTTLPEALPSLNIARGFANVTLSMVAAHRSGISVGVNERNLTLQYALFETGLDPVQGRATVTEVFLRSEPDVTPNTAFTYSNVNYIILGHIIDKLGIPWEQKIQTDLWQPLGMDECGFGPSPQSSPDAIDNPWPHNATANGPVPISPFSKNPPADNPPTWGPAGTVHCTMDSYSRFLSFHLAALVGRDSIILSPSSFKRLHDPYPFTEQSPNAIYTSGGWVYNSFLEDYGGMTLSHSGSNTINYVYAVIAPGKNVSVAAFTNVGGENMGAVGTLNVIRAWFNKDLKLSMQDQGGNRAGSSAARTNIRGSTRMEFFVFIVLATVLLNHS